MADSSQNSLFDNENDEDELTTAAEVIQKLEEVWVNEKLSPELLIYEGELVDCLLDQVQHMESSLQKIEKEDFRIVFHKMELDRIRYILSSYLRIRLEKIEKFGAYLLQQETQNEQGQSNLMSDEERIFAHKFTSSIKNYLHEVALRKMPSNMQSLKLEEVGCCKMDMSVFIKVKKNCRGVIIEDFSEYGEEEIVDLEAGSQHVLRYKPIAPLLKNGSLKLI